MMNPHLCVILREAHACRHSTPQYGTYRYHEDSVVEVAHNPNKWYQHCLQTSLFLWAAIAAKVPTAKTIREANAIAWYQHNEEVPSRIANESRA